jgi:DUF4097 and DUF4098 domain-containing protein YvlB
MTERYEHFEIEGAPRLDVRLGTGQVRCVEGSHGVIDLRIDGRSPEDLIIERLGDTVSVRQPSGRGLGRGSYHITAHVPPDLELEAGLASADISVDATIADLRVSVASGDIRARAIRRDAQVKSASGDMFIESIGGRARLTTASGEVKIGDVTGHCSVTTASGDVAVDSAAGDMEIKTASGDAFVGIFQGRDLNAKTVSGDLRLGLPAGRRVNVDLQSMTGSVELPEGRKDASHDPGETVRIRFRSVSGDVRLERV